MTFLLFAGPTYYGRGGWNDHIKTFDSYNEAVIKAKELINTSEEVDWYQIVNFQKGIIVKEEGECYATI